MLLDYTDDWFFRLASEVEPWTPNASAKMKFRLPLMVLLLPTPPSLFLIIAVNSA
uniref:Uncharacterized protein n=1 Tax=Rhizophora mucronata TaxID=61149 RepID=A0A2P2QA71_RHIMU